MLLLCSIALLFATDFIVLDVNAELTAIINTTLGPIQGEILKTVSKGVSYSSFKGVRYGKPPIGYMRYKPPTFADPWTEVMNATVKRPGCPTLNNNGQLVGDEDCLFLNVFSPVTDLSQSPSILKAVMVYFVGGAFEKGSSNPDIYGPDFFMENDVIIVTLDTRLGALGFLTLNHPNATGNAGLKDQRLALQWVQLNIEKFHGDRNKVTLFGESSGGACALYHTISDNSQGLFHRIASMSGSPFNPTTYVQLAKAQRWTIRLANLLGYNTTDKEELLQIFYNASAESLMKNTVFLADIYIPFGPVLEDPTVSPSSTAFLLECLVERYESGKFSKVPHLMGFTKDEFLIYLDDIYLTAAVRELKFLASETNMSFAIPSAYNLPEGEWNWSLIEECSDFWFKAGMELNQRYISARSSQPLYYYRLTFAPPEKSAHEIAFGITERGAAHGDSIEYMWWASDGSFPLDPEDPISITRERVTRMWTNFAKYGNPTPDGMNDTLLNITWPDYATTQTHLEIGYNLTLGGLNYNENTDAIIKSIEPYLPFLKDCFTYKHLHDDV